ncbi:hypothetical protein AB0M54_24435 [Actinoplanes sp. NPDC051470]|uniref:hypothetical protein n=1 Tax=Actinoplanes sp. NPDC051470 TaxID=3157224 RepID=UPI003431ECE2
MTRNDLVVLCGRLRAALVAAEAALAAFDRVCFTCHRPARDMAQGTDGEWRGSQCAKDYEASAGVQLPIAGGGS